MVVTAGAISAACALFVATPAAAPAEVACESANIEVSPTNFLRVEHALLCLTNNHRIANDKEVLHYDSRLAKAARNHSKDQVANEYFGHQSLEGTNSRFRAEKAGYPVGIQTIVGENINLHSAQATPQNVFDGLKGSEDHNANMLFSGYDAAGVGMVPGFPPNQDKVGGGTTTEVFASDGADTSITGLEPFSRKLYPNCRKALEDRSRARKRLSKAKRRLRRADTRAERRQRSRVVKNRRTKLNKAERQVAKLCGE